MQLKQYKMQIYYYDDFLKVNFPCVLSSGRIVIVAFVYQRQMVTQERLFIPRGILVSFYPDLGYHHGDDVVGDTDNSHDDGGDNSYVTIVVRYDDSGNDNGCGDDGSDDDNDDDGSDSYIGDSGDGDNYDDSDDEECSDNDGVGVVTTLMLESRDTARLGHRIMHALDNYHKQEVSPCRRHSCLSVETLSERSACCPLHCARRSAVVRRRHVTVSRHRESRHGDERRSCRCLLPLLPRPALSAPQFCRSKARKPAQWNGQRI